MFWCKLKHMAANARNIWTGTGFKVRNNGRNFLSVNRTKESDDRTKEYVVVDRCMIIKILWRRFIRCRKRVVTLRSNTSKIFIISNQNLIWSLNQIKFWFMLEIAKEWISSIPILIELRNYTFLIYSVMRLNKIAKILYCFYYKLHDSSKLKSLPN